MKLDCSISWLINSYMYIVLEAFHIYLSKGWLKQIYENTVLSGQYGMAGKSLSEYGEEGITNLSQTAKPMSVLIYIAWILLISHM